jgi:HK97 family phage portal protein
MLENLFGIEKRAISYQTIFETGDDIAIGGLAGVNVNQDSVFQINAVFAATRLIADTISTLPIDVFITRDGEKFTFRPKPAWVIQPDIALPREAFYNQVITSMLIDGNAFIRLFTNDRGEIVNMVVLNPLSVEMKRGADGNVIFTVEGEDRPLSSENILHIPDVLRPGKLRGISRVKAMKEDFGLAIALRNFSATLFGSGASMNGVIEYPGNLTAEQAKNLTESFDSRHRGWRRAHKTGVLTGGATFKSTQIDPDKSQAIEARRLAVEDVARAFGVPNHLMGIPGTTSYASVEESNRQFLTMTLRPIASKIETGLSTLMNRYPGGSGAYVRFNFSALVRSDLSTRAAAYSTGLQSGWLSVNDVRRWEDLSPIAEEQANQPRVPLANVALNESGVRAQGELVKMAASLVQVGFQPSAVLEALGLPTIGHTGLPSVQLQGVAQVDPENPDAAYKDEVN